MMAMGEGTAVSVRGLYKIFGQFHAVDGISFDVPRGSIFGFLGPNGAGKSTTIKMLCGLLTPSAGSGSVGGLDIMSESEGIRRRIGYMSQKFSLYDDLTVEENVRFFGTLYELSGELLDERVEHALALAELGDRRGVMTGTLPGGIKQRLALGCAILHRPEFLFLDEPTSGVDPISRRNFWSIIHDFARSGITVFVTTHYMEEAEYCDYLVLIYRGKIVVEGTPADLKSRGLDRNIFSLSAPDAADLYSALDERPEFDEVNMFGDSVHLVTGLDEAGARAVVMAAVSARRRAIARGGAASNTFAAPKEQAKGGPQAAPSDLRFERVTPSLEDIFVLAIAGADRASASNGAPGSASAPKVAGSSVQSVGGASPSSDAVAQGSARPGSAAKPDAISNNEAGSSGEAGAGRPGTGQDQKGGAK